MVINITFAITLEDAPLKAYRSFMSEYHFNQYRFTEIPNDLLYSALKLRSDIFVVEQNCVYPDLDNKDITKDSVHVLCETPITNQQERNVIAYARCLAPGVSYSGSSIGRVAVALDMRGIGLAQGLMQAAISVCKENWSRYPIEIGAQLYLQRFYENLGFVSYGDPYDEDGIIHIDMRLKIE